MNLKPIFSTAVYLISSLTALLISSRPSNFFFLLIEYKKVPVGSRFRVLLHDVTATILVYGSRQVSVPESPVRGELSSYVNAFFCSNKFVYLDASFRAVMNCPA